MAEITVSEFLKKMRDAGFDYTFTATNGKDQFIGQCEKNEAGEIEIKTKRVK